MFSLIIDTDIGSDVDDLLALVVALGSPGVDLRAVTTVYGDTVLRARLAARVLRIAGRPGIPVAAGADRTLTGRPVWWAGHEGKLAHGLDSEQLTTDVDAVALLLQEADRAAAAGEPLHLLAIGPLTNVALAEQRRPGFCRSLASVTVMGGRFGSPEPEHNIKCDPEAAAVVMAAGADTRIIGLDITHQFRLTAADLDTLPASPLTDLVRAEVQQWWDFTGERANCPHDAVTGIALVAPQLFDFQTGHVHVTVDADGTRGSGSVRLEPSTGGTVSVAASVDRNAVSAEVTRRLRRGCAPTGDAAVGPPGAAAAERR